MDRTRVLLLFGGESSEHDVSISSARNVYAAIDNDKYIVKLCYIDTRGKWWLLDAFDTDIDTSESPQLLPVLGGAGFVTMPGQKPLKPDVILPILHGHGGEDGTVQGLAELMHIPVVGCSAAASTIGMDKVAAKRIAADIGVKVVPYMTHFTEETTPDYEKISQALGGTVFVKPSRAGSSVGISKVRNSDEFSKALDEAHEHDRVVLIERAIEARELEVAILGTPPNHRVSGVGEIIPGADFYSFEDKYSGDSKAQVEVPADISEEIKRQIQTDAMKIYEAIGCSGLSRVDFFLDGEGVVYFNEINTLPGFTNISMYPKLWKHEGVGYSNLIEQLIDDAINRRSI